MSGSPIAGLPAPPPPGASTVQYNYPQFGPGNGQFMSFADEGSTSKGAADKWKYVNPFVWFGKTVTYTNEYRWFNTFRAERRPQYDRRTRGQVTRTGEFKVFRQGNMCWKAEKVQVEIQLELAYHELQKYELWRINMTQEAYYSFFTGFGGVMVDATIDVPAAAAGLASAKSVSTAAAAGTAPSAAALRLGVASKALGLAGWGYLWFQIGTGAVVLISGGTKNAAGDKLSEGWEYIRTFYDSPITEDTLEEWEAVEAPHPCTDAECEIAEQVALLQPGGGLLQRFATIPRRVLVGAGVATIVMVIAFFSFPKGDAPGAATPSPSATATAAASPVAPTATPTQVAGTPANLGATVPAGQVLVFRLDNVDFLTEGLVFTRAHEPFCTYDHIHGPPITSLLPMGGQHLTRSEHLGECGYGPPNFFLIPDPR